jgi:hypothetical protein
VLDDEFDVSAGDNEQRGGIDAASASSSPTASLSGMSL